MSMNQYIKIPSVIAGPFSPTNNRLLFDIPMGSYYDFSNSYLELASSIDAVSPDTNFPQAIFKVGVHDDQIIDDAEQQYDVLQNYQWIRNCRITTKKRGILEDIRNVNVLRKNLHLLTDSTEQILSNNFKNADCTVDESINDENLNSAKLKNTIYRELHKEGNVPSRDTKGYIRIPFSDLFELGKVQSFDLTNDTMRLEVELRAYALVPYGYTMYPAHSDNDPILASDMPATSTTRNVLVIDEYNELYESPFWVNGLIRVDYTVGGNSFNENHLIVNISFDESTKMLSLFLDSDLSQAGDITDIEITHISATNVNLNVDYAELTVQSVEMGEPMSGIYTTFSCEEYNAGGLGNFQKIFMVENNAVGALVMFPKPVLSNLPRLRNYRLILNNVDLTNRDVLVNYDSEQLLDSPLHMAMLNDALMNVGINMKRYLQLSFNSNLVYLHSSTDVNQRSKLMMLGARLPLTQNDKMLQINLNCNTNGANPADLINTIFLYKIVEKQF